MVYRNKLDGREAARIIYGGSMLERLIVPWPKDEVKWRVGSISKDKKKALPLAYVDARTVMERLDEVVGAVNWQDRYEFHGTRIICYLSIRIDNEWICKADGAGDSPVEAEKGGISDAFKRAAVKWGMGRELYELKCKWMPINEYKQLQGNPWDFVIKDAAEDEPEPKLKTKEEMARDTANQIIAEYKKCKTLGELAGIQEKHHKELKAFNDRYPDIFKEINEVGLQVIASFDQ